MTFQRPSFFLRKAPIFCFCFVLVLLLAGNASAQILDRVVAVVNNDVILLSDLNKAGAGYFQQVREKNPEMLPKAKEQVLNDLIDKSLVTQEAKKEKIAVSNLDLENGFQMIIKRSGLSEKEFTDKLKQSGMTVKKYKERLKYQILQEKVITHDVRSKVVITDAMVKAYYDKHKAEYNTIKDGYALLQIGFAWEQTGLPQGSGAPRYLDQAAAKKQAEKVHELAEEGQDFRELAKKYSDLPSAADGGDIGILQKDDMAADMQDAIIHLKPGGISKIIKTPSGFQFFKLLASKEGSDPKASYDSAKEGIREILFQKQMKTEFKNWVKKLEQKAYIKRMSL